MTTPHPTLPNGPLHGLKVLELVRATPGEFVGMMLGDMGAEVLHIDTPSHDALHGQESPQRLAATYTGRNKRSMALDLKSDEGRAILHRLVAQADVLIEGFRPGVMQRLGSDYATLSALNPRLVMCSMSGFGQDGPYRQQPAHDINFLALAGVLALLGEPGGKPAIPLNLVADYGGASMHAALGIVLALFARERTGRGQHVDISYLDSTLALLAAVPNVKGALSDGEVTQRGEGVVGGSYPFYTVYECGDGRLLSVGCTEAHLWQIFCEAIGAPELVSVRRRPEHFRRSANAEEQAARDRIASLLKARGRDEWHDLLVAKGAAVAKVLSPLEALEDPQVRARGMVVELPHATLGPVRQVGVAIKLSETPGAARTPAPRPGEHSEEVLRDLGYTPGDVARLRDLKVIA